MMVENTTFIYKIVNWEENKMANIIYIYSYGSTESCAGVVYQRVGISPAGSIGYLTANTELKLVDENDNGMEFIEIQYKRI